MTPARDTTADVIMPSPRPSESSLRSDHRQNTPITATMPAIITGISSRRSSSAGIVSFFISIHGDVFTGIGFQIVNDNRLNLASSGSQSLPRRRARDFALRISRRLGARNGLAPKTHNSLSHWISAVNRSTATYDADHLFVWRLAHGTQSSLNQFA